MKSSSDIVKTPEQVDFTDLARDLMGRFHYTQNKIAEICRVKPGMVSMVLSGKRNPGEAALELLRREHEALLTPGGAGRSATPPERDDAWDDLQYLRSNAPASYKAAKLAISALKQQAIGGVSSEIASVAARSQAAAGALARRADPKHLRRQKAASPSENKPAQERDVEKGS